MDGNRCTSQASRRSRECSSELCSNNACAGITSNPTADLARLITQLRKHAVSGSVYDGSGKRHVVQLSEAGLFDILQAGDLNPALRALLPAAVVSALRHDSDPLLRLYLLADGLIPSVPDSQPVEGSSEIDEALYATTICEESPFPWPQRTCRRPAWPKLSPSFMHSRLPTSTRSMRAPRSTTAPFPSALRGRMHPRCLRRQVHCQTCRR